MGRNCCGGGGAVVMGERLFWWGRPIAAERMLWS